MNIFSLYFTQGRELYMQRFAVYFTKLFRGKSMFCMQLQDYIKAMMLDFINKRSKEFIDFIDFIVLSFIGCNEFNNIYSLPFIKLVYSVATKYL